MAWFRKSTPSSSAPVAVVARRSDDHGGPFLVSGVTHRQENLAWSGVGVKTFRLVRDIGNPHDQWAVKVMDGDRHIGFITAKNARRYWRAIEKVETNGRPLQVYGEVARTSDGGYIARIDCCWPEDIA